MTRSIGVVMKPRTKSAFAPTYTVETWTTAPPTVKMKPEASLGQRLVYTWTDVVNQIKNTEAEAVFLADFEAGPENPQPLILLATQKLQWEEQPEAAMPVIERAVEVALRVGMWRRHALGEKARVALALDRPAIVEDVLRQLMGLTFTRGNADCGVERDFLDRLPPGSIDADVARAYDEYCRERGALPKALEQQIDDLILSSAAPKWRKVAEITSDVLTACARDKIEITEYAIAKRVDYLAEHDQLQAKGDLRRPRDSEIRLSD